MQGISILGTGSYIPSLAVSNDDFTAFLDTSDEWIRTRTGMQNRYIAVTDPTWYMGAKSAVKALESSGVTPQEIDMILVTTVTPDYYFPSCACLIQQFIGAVNAFAIDINVACSGVAYAYDMARRYLVTGDVKKVLVVSCESLTQTANYEDRASCVLFGDGAGACVLEASDGKFGSFLHSDSSGAKHIYTKKTRSDTPFAKTSQQSEHDLFPAERLELAVMNGREVYKFATKAMPEAVEKSCTKAGVAVGELEVIIPHQANLRIIESAAKNLGLPMEKVFTNIQDYGNTSSASIAIGIDECVRSKRIKRGDLVCVVGFGAGLTYGASVFTY